MKTIVSKYLASDEEVAAAKRERRPIQHEWASADDEAAWAAMEAMDEKIAQMQQERDLMVALLREGGWSWQKVADFHGITRQGAMKTYGPTRDLLASVYEAARFDEQALEEVEALLGKLHRRLGARSLRIVHEVRDADGELVSKHYVKERAEASRRKHPGSTLKEVRRSGRVRNPGDLCERCGKGERRCRCEAQELNLRETQERAAAARAKLKQEQEDEPAF